MALVKTVGAEPLEDKDGGASGVHAEDQDQGPGRIVVGFCDDLRAK